MRKAILDTNFILTCVKQKIDFFEELEREGIEVLIPKQVIKELERLSKAKHKKRHFRDDAKVALKILELNNFKKIDIKSNYVDKGLRDYLKSHPDTILATLDNRLKSSVKNRKIVIKDLKRLEIV